MNDFTHVIVFHDKSKKFIGEATYNAIFELSNTQNHLKIGDSYIAFSSIAKIISKSEFYSQYPKEIPQQAMPEYKDWSGQGIKGLIGNIKSVDALEQMMIGISRYIESTEKKPVMPNMKEARWYKGTNEPIELLEQMKKRKERLLIEQN